MMAASKNNRLAALKLLLQRGADIGVQYAVERVDVRVCVCVCVSVSVYVCVCLCLSETTN